LNITSIGFTGADPGDFSQNTTCGTTLAASATCPITVVFTPAASGSRSGSLTVTDNSNNVTGSTQSATLTGTSVHDVILTWTASTSSWVAGYNVYRGTASGAESTTPVNSTIVTGTTYVDTAVTAGTKYYYVVTAVAANGAIESGNSNEASATVPTP
jgi:fibronectin type 3 domain-containing protein